MKVSIIIPTLNEENYISNILDDISKQSYSEIETIVVDGNSQDQTIQVIKQFKFIQLIQTNPNVAAQRTLGGKNATSELLIFLDADTKIKPDFVQNVVNLYQAKQFHIACPRYLPYSSTILINTFFILFNALFFLFQKISPSGAGCCIIIDQTTFIQSKGFKSELTYDDIEFIRRVSKNNQFKILNQTVYVSDRRFRKYGLLYMTLLYSILSIFFLFNQFKLANNIKYSFGHFK